MHPLLQEMGMTIIFEISGKKPEKNSRLRFDKDAEYVLREITVRTFSICGWKLLLKVFAFSCVIRLFFFALFIVGVKVHSAVPCKSAFKSVDWL